MPRVTKWSGKNTVLQGYGKVGKFYFEAGKNDILKKSEGELKFNMADLKPMKAGRNFIRMAGKDGCKTEVEATPIYDIFYLLGKGNFIFTKETSRKKCLHVATIKM